MSELGSLGGVATGVVLDDHRGASANHSAEWRLVFAVAIGSKADIAYCTAHVRL